MEADLVQGRRREEEKDRNRQNMSVQIREGQAPERILVDRVLDDPRGRPEVVPVERTLALEPLAQAREVAEQQRERGAGDSGAKAAAPVARQREGALQDRPAEHSEGQIEREPCREVRQERQEDDHLLAERVVAERGSGEPRVGGRQRAGADEDVEDREIHRLLAPEDLGVEGAKAQEQEESGGEHGFALKERAAVLAQESEEIVPVAQERPGGGRGEEGQAREDGAASVRDEPERQSERQEVRDEDEAEDAREAEAPIGQTREGRERERHGEQPDEGEAEVPPDRGAQRAGGPGLVGR